jgi:protein tyrosine/serine phosphatase
MSAFEPAVSARFDQQMDQVLAVLADPKRQPIYVHCKHG